MKTNFLTSLSDKGRFFDTIRSRLGYLVASRTFLKRSDAKDNYAPQSYSGFVEDAESFLVVMPESSEDFQNALEFAGSIKKKGKKVILFVKEDKIASLWHKSYYNYIQAKPEDTTRLELPKRKFAHLLRQEKFDVVIDLNIPENIYCSVAANLVNSKYRIGFQKRNSDKFYNLQIINNEINSALSYRNLLNSLQMF
ncbi:MAG: glycosyltransferase family 9 protein [Acidobacteriota bacterium]